MSFQGFVKYEDQDIQVTSHGVTRKGTGRYTVIHGTVNHGLSVLHGLTEGEAEMAVQFLNEQEHGSNWQSIQSRLLWSHNSGLGKLVNPYPVHGGITVKQDPLNLAVLNDRIVFVK